MRRLNMIRAESSVEVRTQNDRLVAVFPVLPEYPVEMGFHDAWESAQALVHCACYVEAMRFALGVLVYGNGSRESVSQAIRFLDDAIRHPGGLDEVVSVGKNAPLLKDPMGMRSKG